jgi:hypothetical protein
MNHIDSNPPEPDPQLKDITNLYQVRKQLLRHYTISLTAFDTDLSPTNRRTTAVSNPKIGGEYVFSPGEGEGMHWMIDY